MHFFLEDVTNAVEPRVYPCMIVVQARLGSTRLPGKVFKTVLGKTLLAYQVERLRRVPGVEGIVIATTTNPQDQPIVDYCIRDGLHYVKGSEEDVLSRYAAACELFGLETLIRVTSDCPLIDPELIGKGLSCFCQNVDALDYLSICHERTFPLGMDFEIMRASALKRAYFEATSPSDKEHVTSYIWKSPDQFRLANLEQRINQSSYRLTVDTEEDFCLIEQILKELYPKNPEFSLTDIVTLLQAHPDWLKINAHVLQKGIG